MKEIFEFRLNLDYTKSLFKKNEGKIIEDLTQVIQISKDDNRFYKIGEIENEVKKKYNSVFIFSWTVIYKYTRSEINDAELFRFKVTRVFEPAGEESGTIYDESVACPVCGSNAKQIGKLKLNLKTIPKSDIACTIAGEYVVSEKFVQLFKKHKFKGATFFPILSSDGKKSTNYYQLKINSPLLHLSDQTIAGVNPFDFSESSETPGTYIEDANYYSKPQKEVYKCPLGHTIGLNLISLPFIKMEAKIYKGDLFITDQKLGVRSGLLRPEPLYMCSTKLRNMIVEEKLKGVSFDTVNIVE